MDEPNLTEESKPLTNKEATTLVFILFILSSLAFAGIYTWAYRDNNTNFAFNDAISKERHKETVTTLKDSLGAKENTLAALTAYLDAGGKGVYEISYENFPSKSSAMLSRVKVAARSDAFQTLFVLKDEGKYSDAAISLVGRDGETFQFDPKALKLTNPLDHIEDFEDPANYLPFVEKALPKIRSAVEGERKTLDQAERAPSNQWGYWDFLYFSITSTVGGGYGDVLPAKTLSRTVVMFQMLVNLFLGSCLLNFLLSGRSNRSSAESPPKEKESPGIMHDCQSEPS